MAERFADTCWDEDATDDPTRNVEINTDSDNEQVFYSLVYIFLCHVRQPILRYSFASVSLHVKGHRDVYEVDIIARTSANVNQKWGRARTNQSTMMDHLLHNHKLKKQ